MRKKTREEENMNDTSKPKGEEENPNKNAICLNVMEIIEFLDEGRWKMREIVRDFFLFFFLII